MGQVEKQPQLKAILFCTKNFLSLDGKEASVKDLLTEPLPMGIAPSLNTLSPTIIPSSVPLSEIPLCFSNSPIQDSLPWHTYVGWDALSEGLQYGFSDGNWISAREILFHPYSMIIDSHLLPLTSSLLDLKSFVKLFPGYDFPAWGGLRSTELILASILIRASREKCELWISNLTDRQSKRMGCRLKEVQISSNLNETWKLEPVSKELVENPQEGQGTLRFSVSGSHVFQCFELDQDKNFFFHSYDQSILLVNELLKGKVENQSDSMVENRELKFSLNGHSVIEESCYKIDQHLIKNGLEPIQRPHSEVIAEAFIEPQLWIEPTGEVQFCRKIQIRNQAVEVWNLPQEATSLLKGLNYGLSATLSQKNSPLVQSRRGIKRDRDLKILRHVGFFAYLVFETTKFLQKRENLETLSQEEINEFFSKLLIQLGSLLYKIEKKAGLISLTTPQSLETVCSAKIVEYIKEYVFKLIDETRNGKDSIFIQEGEFCLASGTKWVLAFFYAILSRVAIQSRGECFLKTRLSLFSSFASGGKATLKEKLVYFSKNEDVFSPLAQTYQVSSSPWLDPSHVLHTLLPMREKRFNLFYKRLPLSHMDMDDFKPEFNLSESNVEPNQNTSIDWFELHPHLFFKGVEIDPVQLQRLSHEGVLEFQGKVYLIQNKNLPSVKRLENFWSKIQQTQTIRGKTKSLDTFLRLPRSQILEMLALRASGVVVKSNSERWNKICDFYDSLNDKRSPLVIPPSICTELKSYQQQGVQWLLDLYDLGLGGILGDDMGLGKTIQTLVFLEILRCRNDLGLVLVIVPTSLTYNWMTELKRFAPQMPAQIFQSKLKTKIAESLEQDPNQVLICTYGLFTEHQEFFELKKWNILIFDEAQNLKNITSKRTTASRSIQAKFKVCLTGTPLENHLGEFYSLLDLAVSGSLGDLSSFKEKFVTPEITNPEDIKYLRLKIKPLILRRTKGEVLAELPPKMESTIKLPFEQKQEKIYRDIALSWNEKVKESILNQGEPKSQLLMLTALLRLRQACSDPGSIPHIKYTEEPPKITVLMEALEEITESGESALVFTQFLHTFERIRKELSTRLSVKTFSLHGGTSRVERERILGEFQETPKGSVLLMTLKTGGVGLNLTKASYVFHLEPWWNPAVEDQATDRTYRMGQQKPVQVYRYLMRESVEEKIEILKSRKLAKFNALFSSTESGTESELISGNALSQADFEYLLSM